MTINDFKSKVNELRKHGYHSMKVIIPFGDCREICLTCHSNNGIERISIFNCRTEAGAKSLKRLLSGVLDSMK